MQPPRGKPPIITLDDAGLGAIARQLIERKPPPSNRAVLAIAGVPGSGKSTLADRLVALLNRAAPGSAVLLAMDAYHMTNAKLARLGLTKRKGAAHTFEAQHYFKHLAKLRNAGQSLSIPIFDRDIDEPVYTGKPEHNATKRTRFVVTEGNYLLLDTLPWTTIDELSDLRVWIDIPADRAKQQAIRRHIRFGRSPQEAKLWYETNDRHNAEFINQRSRHADLIVRWPDG
ncbi:MAG: nucleoside/nucleotide kinase family protein [Phycisphaeraceae bacterium]